MKNSERAYKRSEDIVSREIDNEMILMPSIREGRI